MNTKQQAKNLYQLMQLQRKANRMNQQVEVIIWGYFCTPHCDIACYTEGTPAKQLVRSEVNLSDKKSLARASEVIASIGRKEYETI